MHPNGKFVYAFTPFGANLTVFQEFFNDIAKNVFLNAAVGDAAVSPDGRLLYFTDIFSGTLKVFSTATYRNLFDVPLVPFPTTVATHPDNARVYVVHQFGGGQVTVTDFAAGTITTLSVPNAFDLAVTPSGSRVYVSRGADDAVAVIDTATDTVIANIPVGDDPRGVAISADSAFVYVANQLSGTVSVISTATNTVTATINVGGSPSALVYVTPRGPASKQGCMNGGWATFTNPSFKSQGKCIAFYNSIH